MNKNRIMIFTTTIVLFLLSSSLSSISAFSGTPATNLSTDTFNATYPNVQNVGNNVYVVWSEGSHGVWFRLSTNGGSSFAPAIRLASVATSFPLLSVTGKDVYGVWTAAGSIFVAISTSSGSSFVSAISVSGAVTGCETPAVASYGTDVYVAADCGGHSYITSSSNTGGAWMPLVEYASGPEPQVAAYGSNAYAVADTSTRGAGAVYVTNNNGLTWKGGGSISGAEKWVSAYGSNAVVASESKGTSSVVRVITTTSAGKIWTTAATLSSTVPDSWAPLTGIFGNTEYVAWRSHPGSSASEEYVSVSLNAGSAWSAPITIGIAGHDNSWPVTVATTSGTAFIAWYEKTGTSASSPWNALAVEGTNNGSSWSAPIILGHSLAESDVATEAISANGASMFAVWTNSTSSGNTQVYFATGS